VQDPGAEEAAWGGAKPSICSSLPGSLIAADGSLGLRSPVHPHSRGQEEGARKGCLGDSSQAQTQLFCSCLTSPDLTTWTHPSCKWRRSFDDRQCEIRGKQWGISIGKQPTFSDRSVLYPTLKMSKLNVYLWFPLSVQVPWLKPLNNAMEQCPKQCKRTHGPEKWCHLIRRLCKKNQNSGVVRRRKLLSLPSYNASEYLP
jgi:hypothetical protein